jgi:hypothetical protein
VQIPKKFQKEEKLMDKLRIVVAGFIGLYPTGGVSWDYIQYPVGLKLLGHDVYYIEDTGQYSTYRITERPWDDPYDTIEYLKDTMEKFGLKDKWAYRDTCSNKCYGMPLKKVLEICETADVFINISASSICREEYLKIPKRVLIDSDPMFTQIQTLENKKDADIRYVTNNIKITDYNYHFSFGQNTGNPDCKIPGLNINWIPTRQPICLDLWRVDKQRVVEGHSNSFTTIMNWSTRSKLKFENEEWGQKDMEFLKFISIPEIYTKAPFEIVLSVSADFKKELNPEVITQKGWKILDPSKTIATTKAYQSFIASSYAEFAVAKETYVKSNSGWFSCRSACYLALGKPVITQETSWSRYIPSGLGLFAFSDIEMAINSLNEVKSNYQKHCQGASEIAKEYFDSNKVLNHVISKL